MKIMGKIKKILLYFKENGLLKTFKWIYNHIIFKIRKQEENKSKDFDLTLNTNKKDEKYLTKKNNHNIFLVASIPYYDIGGGQRCSQLAKTFNKLGFNVIYLYAFKSSESKLLNISIPTTAHIFIDDNCIDKISSLVKENDLFIFESPSKKNEPILDFAINSKCKIIYENIDNWETSLGSTVFDEKTLIRLLRSSHLLIGTAKPLCLQLKNYLDKYKIPDKKILYSPNAVDDELFCPLKDFSKPEDLIIGEKTFLYYGSLWGEWFDWDLIIGLAIKNPKFSFNIIGDNGPIKNIMKSCPENIHFLGQKNQVELPKYLQYTDYAMIPFKPGEIGDYVSPLKIFEYISMHTKVLCTNLPDIIGFPNVYIGDTVEEWDNVIKNDNSKVDLIAADKFTQENSWANRITCIIDEIYPEYKNSLLKNNLSIIILNYNNKNVIFKAINTLLQFNDIYNYEIIVVDNGSIDGSFTELKKTYKNKIKLVQNNQNGCSSGRNLGVKHATKKYIMFLDSDQWVTNKYWLKPYENVLLSVKDVGIIGWAAGFFNKQKQAYHVVDSFPYRYMPPNYLCRYDIGYLGSGGMLLLKQDFINVGGFDITYDPTCYEDTDLSLKIRNIGKEIYYCPYLGLIHLPHQTTKSGSEQHSKLIKEKGQYFLNKWDSINPNLLKKFIKYEE